MSSKNLNLTGFFGKKAKKEKPVYDEAKLEEIDAEKLSKGLTADIVLVYPIETEEEIRRTVKNHKKEDKAVDALKERQKTRAEVIVKLRAAGLSVTKSQNELGQSMYIKIGAPLKRIEIEAQRQGLEMLLDPDVAEKERDPIDNDKLTAVLNAGGCCWAAKTLSSLIFGSDSKRVYRDYDQDDAQDFDRSGLKEGRLFSPLERQRLMFSIMEGPLDMKGGGAELDLDLLVSTKIFSTYLSLHSKGQVSLQQEWGAMAKILCLTSPKIRLAANDYLCVGLWCLLVIFYGLYLQSDPSSTLDPALGSIFLVLIVTASFLGMYVQPLDDVRDYYGEKVAFYFGWMEHYSRYLFFLSLFAFAVVLLKSGDYIQRNDAGEIAKLFFCLVVAVWTTVFQEAWKRKSAVLAHVWDCTDFEEEEDPRPEYLANFSRGPWRKRDDENPLVGGFLDIMFNRGQMVEKRGFFTDDGRFIESSNAMASLHKIHPFIYRVNTWLRYVPIMIFIGAIMVIGAASILVFKMLMGVAFAFKDTALDNSAGKLLPMALSTLWITIMNSVYRKVAEKANSLENYRTETENNDALIIKTVIFQFVNSYITLFYIAFIKAAEFEVGGLFGQFDPSTGDPYRDMCGSRPTASSIRALCPDGDLCAAGWEVWGAANVNPMCNTSTFENCDMVFVQRDCFEDLRLLMISYTLLKPCYELPMQIASQIFSKVMGQARYLKSIAEESAKHSLNLANQVGSLAKTGLTKSTSVKEVEVVMEGVGGSSAGASDHDDRVAFHNQIGLQLAQPEYGGTFSEYNPKVIQFGYVAMFSSAFPLSAVCAAVGNFIELRIDSYKLVSLSRRPRWQGAEDIGSWQGVINTISWIALPINVLILVFTSWEFRKLFVIPAVLGHGHSCFDPAYANLYNATASTSLTDPSVTIPASWFVSRHAAYLGFDTSFDAPCVENVQDCFVSIGGVPWLPGTEFLKNNSQISLGYTEYGLCNEDSMLYDGWRCETCLKWQGSVRQFQWITVFILEHALLLLKLLLAYVIPDKPKWVLDETARKAFTKEMRGQIRRETISSQDAAAATRASNKEIEEIQKTINVSDDQNDEAHGHGPERPGLEKMKSYSSNV